MSYITRASDVFDTVITKEVQFLSDNSVLCTVCKPEEKPGASRAREYKIVCRNKKRNKKNKVKEFMDHSVIGLFWLDQTVNSTEDPLSIYD